MFQHYKYPLKVRLTVILISVPLNYPVELLLLVHSDYNRFFEGTSLVTIILSYILGLLVGSVLYFIF